MNLKACQYLYVDKMSYNGMANYYGQWLSTICLKKF